MDQPKDQQEADFMLPGEEVLVECKYTNRFDVRAAGYLGRRARGLGYRALVFTQDTWGVGGESGVYGVPLMFFAPG